MLRLVIVLVLLGSAIPAEAWWDCSWKQRFAADITASPGPALPDYVVRLNLNNANVPASFDWNLNGTDLRLVDTNDVTPLDFLVEQWDAGARVGVVWVRLPSLSGTHRVYLYFDGPAGTLSGSTLATMPAPGMQFYTRRSAVNPVNRATAEAAFNLAPSGTPGYGCASISSYVNINNTGQFAPPNRQDNIALSAEVFFDVGPGDAGTWHFRYGADFGFGGGLYVDDIALQEKWNSNLWWNNNWNNTSQILEGSINLAEGTHSLRILGFEDCCDGGLTAQFRRPGGAWQNLALANIPLRSRACSARAAPSVIFQVGETGDCATLTLTRSSQSFSNPVEGNSNPKAIPGAIILNVTAIENSATGAVDAGSLVLTENIDPDTALVVDNFDSSTAGPVRFVNGSPSSGVSYSFGSLSDPADDLYFSSDGGVSYSYSPVPDGNGVDPAVTNIQIRLTSGFAGASGSGNPSAEFQFKTRIR